MPDLLICNALRVRSIRSLCAAYIRVVALRAQSAHLSASLIILLSIIKSAKCAVLIDDRKFQL
jgi:hypothetical protein